MKRRSLVATDESARHPFLRTLAPHVRRGTAPIPRTGAVAQATAGSLWSDTRTFFGTYVAALVAALIFIG